MFPKPFKSMLIKKMPTVIQNLYKQFYDISTVKQINVKKIVLPNFDHENQRDFDTRVISTWPNLFLIQDISAF